MECSLAVMWGQFILVCGDIILSAKFVGFDDTEWPGSGALHSGMYIKYTMVFD